MASNNSTNSSNAPSRSYTASSISSGSINESRPNADAYEATNATNVNGTRKSRNSHTDEKRERKFSLDGFPEREAINAAAREDELLDDSPGTLPDVYYEAQMSWWRAGFRRLLVRNLQYESQAIGYIQRKVRTRLLDKYFLYSSALGSHTFFMSALPAMFYFGHGDIGRGLVQIMCVGVYISSFIKDCFCSPRPFVPPVTRLSIGTHHLEYGFPSTHSTNSMSFTTYIFVLLQFAASDPDSAFAAPMTYWFSMSLIILYGGSIVLGRIYCGMHSFTDCVVGTFLGSSIGLAQGIYGNQIEEFIAGANWVLPVVASLLCLLLVNQHPQPVDDCPCFEDAIASLALLTGTVISRWHAAKYDMDVPSGFFTSRTPGWENLTWEDTLVWWLFAVLKMVTGVSALFAWRLIVKQIMHKVLPPLFRWASGFVGNLGWTLPHRRWYTPATEYKSVPQEKGLHPIPSSMNLPAEFLQSGDAHTTGRLPQAHLYSAARDLKKRTGFSTHDRQGEIGAKRVEFVDSKGEKLNAYDGELREKQIKHYDADVLTKVIVYSGIGAIATYLTPVTFELLGWGVQPVN